MSIATAEKKYALHPAFYLIAALLLGLLVATFSLRFSPILALVAAVGLGVALIFLRYPEYALLLTVALIPIERFGRFTDDNTHFTISLMRIMGVLVLGILIVHKLVKNESFSFGKPFFLYAGYAGLALLSIVYTTDFLGSVRAASTIVGNLLFYFVVINMVTNRKRVFTCLLIWLSVSVLMAGYSTFDWHYGSGASEMSQIGGEIDPGKGVQSTENRWSTVWTDRAETETLGDKSLRRSMGPTSHAAVYAINCIMTIPFLLFLLRLPYHRNWKGIILVSLGLISYNILLTNARAAILLAAVVVALCAVRGIFALRPYIIAAGCSVMAVFAFFVPVDVYDRILNLSNYTFEKSASLRIRYEYVQAGLRSISENWLLGSGVANENIVPKYLNSWSTAPEQTTVHNEYLQTTMELGILGFTFHFGFIAAMYWYAATAAKSFRVREETQQEYWFMVAVQIMMVSVLLYALQMDVFHFPLKGWWLIAGLTAVMYKLSNQPQEHHPTATPAPTEVP